MPLTQYTESPRYLRLHEADIVNDGGVSAGTAFGRRWAELGTS